MLPREERKLTIGEGKNEKKLVLIEKKKENSKESKKITNLS